MTLSICPGNDVLLICQSFGQEVVWVDPFTLTTSSSSASCDKCVGFAKIMTRDSKRLFLHQLVMT
ncbi:hypothetical protein ACPV5U_29245, partial [Vibrio mediterranei]